MSVYQDQSMDIDYSRRYVYTSDGNDIKLFKWDNDDLEYTNIIPVVKTYTKELVNPENLKMFNDGNKMLMLDRNNYDSILSLDVERGIVESKTTPHEKFTYSDDVSFKVRGFDYGVKNDLNCKYVVGINNNHIMKISTSGGELVDKKLFMKSQYFTCVCTDSNGNIFVGDKYGNIKFFKDVNGKSVKVFNGLGDCITHIDVTDSGSILATTDSYVVYLNKFSKDDNIDYKVIKIDNEVKKYLSIENNKILNAQFLNDETVINFSIGKYIFHWSIDDIINDIHNYNVYESDNLVLCHKLNKEYNTQFVLDCKNNPHKIGI